MHEVARAERASRCPSSSVLRILFPLGRFVIGEVWLNVASDALFVVALGALARLSWRQGRAGEIDAPAAEPQPASG